MYRLFLVFGIHGVKKNLFAQKNALSPLLTPAERKILVLLYASVERFSVSRMRDFDNKYSLGSRLD